ncbi:MAG: hypothetical protein HQL95_06135, partial [Magnetococcales bacterium]|nr:hypothetical protein [Magnetococcales bacterium]
SKGKALGTLLLTLARFSKGNCEAIPARPAKPQSDAFSAVRPALPSGLKFNIPKWARFKKENLLNATAIHKWILLTINFSLLSGATRNIL